MAFRSALFLMLLAAGPAAAQTAPDRAFSYADCMALARRDPDAALDRAMAWAALGGSAAADHCAATALFQAGRYRLAAERFETLGATAPRPPEDRARILDQAAQAWVRAGDLDRALAVADTALRLSPDDPTLLGDRAVMLAQADRYWEAVDDLNRVLDLHPGDVDALVLRASAYRRLDALDLAADDLERALDLEPGNLEGLLERGMVRRLNGDRAGARADWMTILRTAPETPVAVTARANLERMDVTPPGQDTPGKSAPR
ncbi:MAG: tetratricopeptide repeat protein [Rhodobacterales bacterium]|nr:tetratricopeptide repeat protein [Rhodobacterales bacterium]